MTAEAVLSHGIPSQKIRLDPNEKRVIAIDGTARVGKGTLARALAEHFRLFHLDSGSIYRAVTLLVIDWNIPHDYHARIADLIFDVTPNALSSPRIRTHEVSSLVPKIAKNPELRARVRGFQHKLVEESSRGAVVEGRDICTNVFPDAQVKFFLTASPRERARRAMADMQRQGKFVSLKDLEHSIIARDREDMERSVDPLVQHPDAHLIDSSLHSINSVLLIACGYITSRFENF